MDVCVAPKPKKLQNSECPLISIKPEENAQKVNNFSQNNNATVGQSFIPVYTKKTEMCHNFHRNATDEKSPCKRADSPEPTKSLHFGHSPPVRQRVLPDTSEQTAPVKTWSMHMRRRSVGFEDMTSMASRYGYNLTNDQRVKTRTRNFNIESGPVTFTRSSTHSENDKVIATKLKTDSDNGSRVNQNIQLSSENENNHLLRGAKPSQYLKDKSSKRKSSLNRIDFIDDPNCAGNNHHEKVSLQKHSSSDEEDSKALHTKPESSSANSKRKHNVGSSSPSLPKAADRKNVKVPQPNTTTGKGYSNPLPQSLQKTHPKTRQHKRTSSASHLQKLSHSAGELESLTDPSESVAGGNQKVCLSAQEFDTEETRQRRLKRHSQVYQPARSPRSPWKKTNDTSGPCPSSKSSNQPDQSSAKNNPRESPSSVKEPDRCNLANNTEPVVGCLQLNGLVLKHADSQSEDDATHNVTRMASLDISQDACANPTTGDNEIYISAEENLEDSTDKRRGSILRKTTSEGKRALHGILKPRSEENLRTLPSILKHRESSEEKETWLQAGDLHSILKKSTSEEESCNSGSDAIRPILKQLSTDDESPSGSGSFSPRPRPILKKRTSFSEECYYASYPNGELKPILKKKISSIRSTSSADQPRPILKSRRKSEDVRSFREFVASRPRAYSADAGVVKRSKDGQSRSNDGERRSNDGEARFDGVSRSNYGEARFEGEILNNDCRARFDGESRSNDGVTRFEGECRSNNGEARFEGGSRSKDGEEWFEGESRSNGAQIRFEGESRDNGAETRFEDASEGEEL